MLEQVATETLQEKVYTAIKDSIMRNDLLPGQPLAIDDLARDSDFLSNLCYDKALIIT